MSPEEKREVKEKFKKFVERKREAAEKREAEEVPEKREAADVPEKVRISILIRPILSHYQTDDNNISFIWSTDRYWNNLKIKIPC